MDADQRVAYCQALEQVLLERDPNYRGTSADYALMAHYMDEEIPLRVVLTGIRLCSGKPNRVTFRYFKRPIDEEILRWSTALPR